MPGHFALLYATDHPSRDAIDHAHDVFAALSAKLGPWEVAPVRSREVVTYLDFASHELLADHPHDYDAARSTIAQARAFDIVVSAAMLENRHRPREADRARNPQPQMRSPAPDHRRPEAVTSRRKA